MKQFLVLYKAPVTVLDEWMKTPEEIRKPQEKKMEEDWNTWNDAHKSMFVGGTAGAGKTKLVTGTGVEDFRNDIMLYSIVEGVAHEEVAKAFEGHPHFGIPEASIEIMQINQVPGM